MDKDIEAFRKEVAHWRGERRRAGKYPAALKETALQLWDRLRSEGATSADAAKHVGISAASLHLWRRDTGAKRLVRVQLVPESRPKMTAQPVRLLSPGGYRVEVPDVAAAVTLLRELG